MSKDAALEETRTESTDVDTKAIPLTLEPEAKHRPVLRAVLMICVPAILILIGVTVYYAGGRYVTTDNAYVKAPITSVVSQTTGRVAEVLVRENQIIEAGHTMLRLESREFELAVKEAEANLADVVQELENRRAELRRAGVDIRRHKERRRYMASVYKRRQMMAAKGIELGTKLDEAQHQFRTADNELIAARERESGILASLGGDPKASLKTHPKYVAAAARLDRARLDLERSVLTAPTGGIVVKMTLEAGEYIESGASLFAIVQTDAPWVEANLKETELTHIQPGQTATFFAEAYPDVQWTGKVVGISPATGAEFAVLPPQNASGNWVKVVQRLPVRLAIDDSGAANKPALRVGMSVVVSIDTGHERKAPPIISSVLAATRSFAGVPDRAKP